MTTLEDPDSLLLRCRDLNPRQLLLEAIRSHQTGAQRAAVVSIWIAVVYDIFGKARELAQAGDLAAKAFVDQLDRAIVADDISTAQKLEASILKEARDKFELLSANEFRDLQRLYEDRHRCAHPSLNRPEEIYTPTPELVRVHLRNAVDHLLSQPPVQGRAALARLQQEVDSDLFPRNVAHAAEYIRGGIFRRMKAGLVRDFCSAAMASCITDSDLSLERFSRRVRALNALRTIAPDVVSRALTDKITAVARTAPDTDVHRIVILVASIDGLHLHLEPDVVIRIQSYIRTAPKSELFWCLRYSLRIPTLVELARTRIGDLTPSDIRKALVEDLVEAMGDSDTLPPELLARVVELYVDATSWSTANALAEAFIVPHSSSLTPEQVGKILAAFPTSRELYGSSTRLSVLRGLAATGFADQVLVDGALTSCQLTREDLVD